MAKKFPGRSERKRYYGNDRDPEDIKLSLDDWIQTKVSLINVYIVDTWCVGPV